MADPRVDTRYGYRAWDDDRTYGDSAYRRIDAGLVIPEDYVPPPPYADGSPRFPLLGDSQLESDVMLMSMQGDDEAIRLTRPPVGNVPFPPRTGYEQRALTIEDVLQVGPAAPVEDPMRQTSGTEGSPSNSQGQW